MGGPVLIKLIPSTFCFLCVVLCCVVLCCVVLCSILPQSLEDAIEIRGVHVPARK